MPYTTAASLEMSDEPYLCANCSAHLIKHSEAQDEQTLSLGFQILSQCYYCECNLNATIRLQRYGRMVQPKCTGDENLTFYVKFVLISDLSAFS